MWAEGGLVGTGTLERCLFLEYFCGGGPRAIPEPFSVSFLLVSCSQLSPGLHTESQNFLNIMAKQLNEGKKSGHKTVHGCTETCIIAACRAKALNHKSGTGKEKQLDIAPLYDPPHADHMLTLA